MQYTSGATVQRDYLALVEQSGQLAAKPQGTITDPLRGPGGSLQPATTTYKTLHSNDKVALLRLTPKTGRYAITGCLLRPDHTACTITASGLIPLPPPPPTITPPPPLAPYPTDVCQPVVGRSEIFDGLL